VLLDACVPYQQQLAAFYCALTHFYGLAKSANGKGFDLVRALEFAQSASTVLFATASNQQCTARGRSLFRLGHRLLFEQLDDRRRVERRPRFLSTPRFTVPKPSLGLRALCSNQFFPDVSEPQRARSRSELSRIISRPANLYGWSRKCQAPASAGYVLSVGDSFPFLPLCLFVRNISAVGSFCVSRPIVFEWTGYFHRLVVARGRAGRKA